LIRVFLAWYLTRNSLFTLIPIEGSSADFSI
jgi:hypothetical protein